MEIAAQNPPQRRLVPHDDVIQALAANRSDQSSTYGFCQGDRGAVTTSSIPMLFVRATNAPPKIASRSRIQYRGAWSHGNASRICCAVHSSVGCSVTLKCTTRRRSWERTTKTNSTRNQAVGTVKKSIDAICCMWFFKNGRQVCDGGLRFRRRCFPTVDGATSIPSLSSSP